MEISQTRRPQDRYVGNNGFIDLQLQNSQPLSQLGPIAHSDQQRPRKEKNLRDAVERHRQAENMLEIKGTYCPSLDAMRAELEQPLTSDAIKERTKDLQKQHEDEMARLLDHQVADYYRNARDAYCSKDDGISCKEIDDFYNNIAKPYTPTLSNLNSEYTEHRYAYLRSFNALNKQRMELRAREELARKQRDAQFPKTVAEFHAIPERDIRMRVARFLLADTTRKDKMLSEFGWVWRQVTPLANEYVSNTAFHDEIQALGRDIETSQAKDPRKRPS